MLRGKYLFLALALLGLAATAERAAAHATSIGFANNGPGSVVVWLGTYAHGPSSHHLEGSMNLVGVNGNPFPSTTSPFTLGAGVGPLPDFDGLGASPAATKPAGLIDGTTHFYAQGSCCGNNLPLLATNTTGLVVDHWQGAVFNTLTPGDYQFSWTPIQNPTAEWSLWSNSMNGIFTITGEVIGCGQEGAPPCPEPVPEPATLPLMGFGLIGLAAILRRRQKAA